MAFEINVGNPLAGPSEFLVGYLGAKQRAEAETARLKAIQRQHMADTIGGAIGNVGGAFGQGWSQGVMQKYRLQDQRETQRIQDERRLKQEKQVAKYKSDLDKDEEYFKLSGGLTQDEGLDYGRKRFEQAPPEEQARIAHDFGVDPTKLDAKSPLYKHIAVNDYQGQIAARREHQYQAHQQAILDRKLMEKQQADNLQKSQAFLANEANMPNDPETEKAIRINQKGIEAAKLDGNHSAEWIADSTRTLHQQIAANIDKIKPIEQPANNFGEWQSGKKPKPGVPYVAPDGRMTVFDAKGTPHTSAPPKTDAPQVTVQPPPPQPVSAPDGSQWIWDGKTYKPHVVKETPEQKQETEIEKEQRARAAKIASEKITEGSGENKKTRYKTPDEVAQELALQDHALDLLKNSATEPPAMPIMKADSSGISPAYRVMHTINSGGTPQDVDKLIGSMSHTGIFGGPNLTPQEIGELSNYARDMFAFKARPKGTSKVNPSEQFIEGKVYEDASGKRRRWQGGKWVSLDAGN